MKNLILTFLILLSFSSCKQPCDLVMIEGEVVQIPIEFEGFTQSEIKNISVYRIDNLNPFPIDTLIMNQILWSNQENSFNNFITDNAFQSTFGYFNSYLDNCDLVLSWQNGGDTLSNFIIKKSHAKTNECHEGDPNVKIDQISFKHNGITINKNESIKIKK